MRQHNQKLLAVFSGLLAFSMAACKPAKDDSGSRVKTLDSIANGTLDLDAYQCKGSNAIAITDDKIIFDKEDSQKINPAKQSELRRAVKDYFSALPDSAEDLFLKMGGQVLITNRVNDLCAASHYGRNLDESKGEKTDGCFHFVDDPSGKKAPIFTLVHSPDAKKIRYYGPQIFGYLYAQFYSRLTLASNQKGIVISQQEPMRLIALKEKVANAFLNDILATKDYKIDVIENLLGQNSDKELKNSSIELPLERLSSLKDAKRRSQFLDYVYANSFQSAHCNSRSLDVANAKFKKSSALFAEVDSAVIDVSKALLGISSASAEAKRSSSGSFSLAGGDLLSTIMPLFSNLLGGGGGGGGGGLGGIADMFMSLLGGGGGGGGIGDLLSSLGGGGDDSAGGMFDDLSSSGCQSGSCSGCSGSCSGGTCSSCSNGSCGGSCGSCSCGS